MLFAASCGMLSVNMPDILIRIAVWGALIVLGLVGLYLFVALGLVACVGIFAGISNFFRELSVERRMRLAGRFLPWRQALERIKDSQGTLILESPTIGWAISRAWWTPDDVLAKAPAIPPDMTERHTETLSDHPYIAWCYQEYTHLDHGGAYLIAAYNGHRHAKRLTARFPGLTKVDLWSGAIGLSDLLGNTSR